MMTPHCTSTEMAIKSDHNARRAKQEIVFQCILLTTLLVELAILRHHIPLSLILGALLAHVILSGIAAKLASKEQHKEALHQHPPVALLNILLLLALLWGGAIFLFQKANQIPATLHTIFLLGILWAYLNHLASRTLAALTSAFLLMAPAFFILFQSTNLYIESALAIALISCTFFIYRERACHQSTESEKKQIDPAFSSPSNREQHLQPDTSSSTPDTLVNIQTPLQQISNNSPAQTLARNEAIWDAILTITDQSHLQSSWQNCFSGKLSNLCQPLETDRIYIVEARSYQQNTPAQTKFQATLDHSWIFSSPSCIAQLSLGQIIHNESPEISLTEAQSLEELGIKSFVDIPILLKNELWGIIGMDRLTKADTFTPQQIKGLRFIANILAMTIRNQRDRAERDRLATVVEQSSDCILITDPTGLILYANPACESVTGYTQLEAIGASLKSLYPESSMDSHIWKHIWTAMQKGECWQGQFTAHRKDHTLYEEEILVSPAHDQHSEVTNQVIIKRNITEKKRLESIAEAANLMDNIGFIFSSIRHELGNPINSIKVSLSVLDSNLETYDTNDIKRFITRCLSDIGRVEYLLKTLKNFSTFERPNIEKTDFTTLIKKFITLVTPDLQQKQIHLRTTIPSIPLFGLVDPRAFQQVLLNLIANAADSLSEAFPKNIFFSMVRDENGAVNIIIQDNGCGISKEEQTNLFKPFYTTKEHGTGLGLVIVKKMLSKMNCSIEIFSNVNMGTKVIIVIPGC